MREDVQDMVKQTKQRINAFLLKQGKQYDQGKSKWTICHRKWLKKKLNLPHFIEKCSMNI